ncbi:MAG: hypothetical protein J6L81_08935 [Clostridia bacterium]|nr:hypothetical protein [Clostridia bacterium]
MYYVNGVELEEIDIFDADVAAKYEDEIDRCRKRVCEVDASQPYSAVIGSMCAPVFDAFDSLFGEGTAERLFCGKANIKICLKALTELVAQVESQKESFDQLPEELLSSFARGNKDDGEQETEQTSERVYTAKDIAELFNRLDV